MTVVPLVYGASLQLHVYKNDCMFMEVYSKKNDRIWIHEI